MLAGNWPNGNLAPLGAGQDYEVHTKRKRQPAKATTVKIPTEIAAWRRPARVLIFVCEVVLLRVGDKRLFLLRCTADHWCDWGRSALTCSPSTAWLPFRLGCSSMRSRCLWLVVTAAVRLIATVQCRDVPLRPYRAGIAFEIPSEPRVRFGSKAAVQQGPAPVLDLRSTSGSGPTVTRAAGSFVPGSYSYTAQIASLFDHRAGARRAASLALSIAAISCRANSGNI